MLQIRISLIKRRLRKYIFALKENAGKEPFELAIEFVTKSGVPFIYSVEMNDTGVTFETLQVSSLAQEKMLMFSYVKAGR